MKVSKGFQGSSQVPSGAVKMPWLPLKSIRKLELRHRFVHEQ
jgi:hypothetical protein